MAEKSGSTILLTNDPFEAVNGVDAVYTDAWISMGDAEDERTARLKVFAPYQVNKTLMSRARDDAIFMHCLPDHRGEEVTAEIVDGSRSVVFDQAENRLHSSLAILDALHHGTAPWFAGYQRNSGEQLRMRAVIALGGNALLHAGSRWRPTCNWPMCVGQRLSSLKSQKTMKSS